MPTTHRIAVDIGGTFTDIAFLTPEGGIASRKVPSTPEDYARGVISGLEALTSEIDLSFESIGELLHGCTVATNAILENKGAKTALVTTRGFRDILELRRIRIPRLYEPLYVKPKPLVPRQLRLEVAERIGPDGEVIAPLDREDLGRAIEKIKSAGVEAVAVSFLHSYANPDHERIVGEVLRSELPDTFISLSIEILPQIREYERTSTTVINSYVGPPVKDYLESLIDQMREKGSGGRLLVMQSSGGVLDAELLLDRPAQIVECGPAAGVIGAAHVAATTGDRDLITLDMGGTTAKASIIEDGELVQTDEYEVGGGISLSNPLVKGGGYALKLPVIDISEVGAGGGSIVWMDKAGSLKVGPRSAGAEPGPVCYDSGGAQPTVTDANLVLGYLNPQALAGGAVSLNADKARTVIHREIATPLGRNLLETAHGIHTIANANMMRAVKAVTTYRGRDPRDFTLLAFGGSGGVHAVSLAREMEIRRVVIPPAAGVFSALGLLCSDIEHTLSRAFLSRTSQVSPEALTAHYEALEQEVLKHMGYRPQQVTLRRSADLRYVGQAFELSLPVPSGPLGDSEVRDLERIFEEEHEKTYGHRLAGDRPIETVSLGVAGSVKTDRPDAFRIPASGRRGDLRRRSAYFGPEVGALDTPVIVRGDLSATPQGGPLIVEEYDATTVVPPGWTASIDRLGQIVIEVEK